MKFLNWIAALSLLMSALQAPAQDVIREGVYDGGPNKVFIKAVVTEMPGRRNTNYFGLIVSEVMGGGMLAKAYKIEERGGRQAWIPIHQGCTNEDGRGCQFTGFLTLPAMMEAFYTGILTNQGGAESLLLVPATPYSRVDGRQAAPLCKDFDFGRSGFRRVSGAGDVSWNDISGAPNNSFRFIRSWSDTKGIDRDAARLSMTTGSGAAQRGFYLDTPVKYADPAGRAYFDLRSGSYSMTPSMAGLGEIRLQLDDASARSGTAVSEPMQAVGIFLRNAKRSFLFMMDARPGYDNCNMTAMSFVQE